MKKEKYFHQVKFSPEVIKKMWKKLASYLDEERKKRVQSMLKVGSRTESWWHDTESEFFSDYVKDCKSATFVKTAGYEYGLNIMFFGSYTTVEISAPQRDKIEEIFQICDESVPRCQLPQEIERAIVEPVIFVGHGQSEQWRQLKDHLQDKHGYSIEAYEVGARAGHAIRDILEDMLDKSSLAILVMTGEDKDADGGIHARDNVIHELGLFQGRLGFARAIILLEDGTQEFSNIHGIHQIRFSKGNIKETFGDVLAVLGREFEKS